MIFLALFAIFAFGEPGKLAIGMIGWIALGVLPALNAFFDLASLQLSRWFLDKIKEHDRYLNILWIVADVLVAIVLLMGLYGAIFLSLDAVDRHLFPDATLFAADRWRELFWERRDWFHPEILWLTLMALTTLVVTAIHLVFVFAHLFVPLWHLRDQEKIDELIRDIRKRAAAHPENKFQESDCRALAKAYYFPWEHGIALGALTLWMLGYALHRVAIHG
uniref:Uncharacterized protein n=1 Tax=Candidatus Kentrum sp. TC TaxID=2126339 RepID=A0A451A8B4_9GAMM|nr:MAG: hypothetical protein BECKTC1821F_GA0114240_10726 [Candidatus Kentron sp. TC]